MSADNAAIIDSYLASVVEFEGRFAQPGIAYDPISGYTYDGHPLDYATGKLIGEPHLFSAPSKESIHLAILSLAIDGNKYAQQFAGGFDAALRTLKTKVEGYETFNRRYPGYGCFTPWVGFSEDGFEPLESWSDKVPGLDNGEWFWSIYATAYALERLGPDPDHADLAKRYRAIVDCQKRNAKMIFYRGDGDTSAVSYVLNGSVFPTPSNYAHCDGYLNDPYEGETLTVLMYLFSDWSSEKERNKLWEKKRDMFEAVNFTIPVVPGVTPPSIYNKITVQKGYWFSTHEQWKTLLLPYLSDDLPVVRKVFRNAEKARVWDALLTNQSGLLASINDVTDGSQEIPDYASACGIESIAYEKIDRRDLFTPYGSFGLFLHNKEVGFCWYNNMLSGPRMQSSYGSTEAINANGTEISPLTTWDSKITTVLAMLGGIGDLVARALKSEPDSLHGTAYHRFVHIVNHEFSLVFPSESAVLGDEFDFVIPNSTIPSDKLSDWAAC